MEVLWTSNDPMRARVHTKTLQTGDLFFGKPSRNKTVDSQGGVNHTDNMERDTLQQHQKDKSLRGQQDDKSMCMTIPVNVIFSSNVFQEAVMLSCGEPDRALQQRLGKLVSSSYQHNDNRQQFSIGSALRGGTHGSSRVLLCLGLRCHQCHNRLHDRSHDHLLEDMC